MTKIVGNKNMLKADGEKYNRTAPFDITGCLCNELGACFRSL